MPDVQKPYLVVRLLEKHFILHLSIFHDVVNVCQVLLLFVGRFVDIVFVSVTANFPQEVLEIGAANSLEVLFVVVGADQLLES